MWQESWEEHADWNLKKAPRNALSVCCLCSAFTVAVLVAGGLGAAEPREGEPVNVAPFGQVMKWDQQGKDYGVIWEDARDVFQVTVAFAGAGGLPAPEAIHLEYWQSSWPHRRIPRDQPSGAGSSGWLDIGDWFQGRWKKADTELKVEGSTYSFTFRPVNAAEFKDLGDFSAPYRSTLKLRVVGESPLPEVTRLAAMTDSVWRSLSFEVEWGGTSEDEQVWDGRLEAFNGIVESVEPLSASSTVRMKEDKSWESNLQGSTDGIRARVLRAETKGTNSFDEAIFTVRSVCETFSFAASDLIKEGKIFLPDFGVLVRKVDSAEAGDKSAASSYKDVEQAWRDRTSKDKPKDLYSRVANAPEQTFPQAWNDTPTKDHHYIPLSFEAGRQHFGVEADGGVFCVKNWISRLRGKDTDRCLWEGDDIRYGFGLPDGPIAERGLVEGFLPIISASWARSGVSYSQTALVMPLLGVPPAGGRIWADDTLVLRSRIVMRMQGAAPTTAGLSFAVSDGKGSQKLSLDGDLIVGTFGDKKAPRMLVSSPDGVALSEKEGVVTASVPLLAESPSRTLDVAIPFITLTEGKEWELIRTVPFEEALKKVRDYWRSRVWSGTQIVTPEPMINDYYKAHVVHLLINTEREVGVSDRYMAKVGTFHYGVYANESCMMVSDLDRRGFHERAEQALETWLHYQGTVGLPGDFLTAEGQLYGAGGYEHGGYNQHHGWVLWCLGEHFLYTRDVAWLEHAAPYIIKACDWVSGERSRTVEEAERTPIRAIERGLLPPGRLEDIGDWRSWLSTNVFTWWGIQNAALALQAASHPEASRLIEEAEGYRQDILSAYREAMRRSPVVKLRDGSWIPHVPPDVHRRGRSFGWITETLEGAIHLVRCGALDPWDRLSTWILKDFEDNLYISEQYGYNITGRELERYWFSRGGISMQANLLCSPLPYMLRDEPKHYLRAYFNAFAVSYFPDTRMMTEHALPNIGDWRGDHYKSSDEANSAFWLRLMFISERGNELWLGQAIPRYWLADGQRVSIQNAATYFGPMSMEMESLVSRGEIRMSLDLPKRNPPEVIRARFRHPEGRRMLRCEVDGVAYDNFDPEKEWVELDQYPQVQKITAFYE